MQQRLSPLVVLQRLHIAPSALVNPTILLTTDDLVKIFNKLSDKELLLDVPGAGTPELANCCHGGCDNCAVSHIFDSLSSGRPKWIALYPYRRFIDGRDHSPRWMQLFEGLEAAQSVDGFIRSFRAMDSQMTMGTPSIPDEDTDVSYEALCSFWTLVCDGKPEIKAVDFADALKRLTGEEHGALFGSFARLLQ